MFRKISPILLLAIVIAPAAAAFAQAPANGGQAKGTTDAEGIFNSISWTVGEGHAEIGDQARINVPLGMRYTGRDGTQKMLELMHNPTYGTELGLLTTNGFEWFLNFEFSDIGYIKDADKEKLDAEAILESIREGNEAGNEARRERGWAPINIVGWQTPPFYNKETNNLEWCIKGESEGRTIVNYNTRILGRGGVMSANLMVAPEKLAEVLLVVKQLLSGFSFIEGKRYAEWRSGDKIAKYGLTALVVGGAVGVAAKVGFLAKLGKLWKPIILGL
ncbi:MAG TPA: DUF2167 domain-containing protein, partial [Polyangia bacterium]